jgi:hypothetical protein
MSAVGSTAAYPLLPTAVAENRRDARGRLIVAGKKA